MGTLCLTIEVLDLSPKVTLTDLNIFFSYCGSVDNIQLQRNKNRSQLAFVTFKQPYAYHTSLLLNGAIIVNRPARILALRDSINLPIPNNMISIEIQEPFRDPTPHFVQHAGHTFGIRRLTGILNKASKPCLRALHNKDG